MTFDKRVAQELRDLLKEMRPLHLPLELHQARQQEQPILEAAKDVQKSKLFITGAEGNKMLLNLYEPVDRNTDKLPVLLWMHGGGYILGHPDHDDLVCQEFVQQANCVVVSPDYRLAPEHPYPAAIEDCFSALLWLEQASDRLNIDISKIAIGGGSAGGGLAAGLALLNRDRGGPKLIFQMPLYPMLDYRNITPSSYEMVDERVWGRNNNQVAWSMYLGELMKEPVSPYASPGLANDLSDLPPVYTCVGQLDPFRDETIEYVSRLAVAGVPVQFHLYPGAFHAFERAVPNADISLRARAEYCRALADAFKR